MKTDYEYSIIRKIFSDKLMKMSMDSFKEYRIKEILRVK